MTHSSPAAARERVVRLLGSAVHQALGLKESLQNERVALEAEDTEGLHAALEDKGRYVGELQSLEQERATFCSQLGFEAGPMQMEQIIEWCDQDSTIANRWQHLIDIAIDCNALNLTNGAIIRVRKQQIESGLSVLRGCSSGDETYGRGGPGSAALRPRTLAEA